MKPQSSLHRSERSLAVFLVQVTFLRLEANFSRNNILPVKGLSNFVHAQQPLVDVYYNISCEGNKVNACCTWLNCIRCWITQFG